MNKAFSIMAGSLLGLACFSLSAQEAAVPVLDRSNAPAASVQSGRLATPLVSTPLVATPVVAAPAAPNQLAELLMTIDQLKEEVGLLRGQLEEQGHRMKKMQADQRDRYRDLDRRISFLTQRIASRPRVAPAPVVVTPGATPLTQSAAAEPLPAPTPRVSDQQAYKEAFALVRQRDFDQSLKAFDSFQRDYPQSSLLPNVLYWSGEVLRAKPEPDLEKAGQYYLQVIERFPKHQKAAEAHYKLGITYDALGNQTGATEMMNKVVTQFPGQPSANLARDYLSKH